MECFDGLTKNLCHENCTQNLTTFFKKARGMLQEKLTQQTMPRGQNTTCDGCVIIPLQLGLQIVLGMGVPSNFSHAAALTATNVENAMISEVKYFMIQLIFVHYTYCTKVNGLYLKRLMLP